MEKMCLIVGPVIVRKEASYWMHRVDAQTAVIWGGCWIALLLVPAVLLLVYGIQDALRIRPWLP